MFLALLLVTFLVALLTAGAVVRLFRAPIGQILDRLVPRDMSGAWQRYLGFAIIVVGISNGVRIWDLEKYITARTDEGAPIVLNSDRWVLEVYRTVVSTLESTAWMLLVFFVFALIAYVVTRGFEMMHSTRSRD